MYCWVSQPAELLGQLSNTAAVAKAQVHILFNACSLLGSILVACSPPYVSFFAFSGCRLSCLLSFFPAGLPACACFLHSAAPVSHPYCRGLACASLLLQLGACLSASSAKTKPNMPPLKGTCKGTSVHPNRTKGLVHEKAS